MSYAVVTGAGRGIGRAVAVALADRGFDVALLGLSESHLRETAELLTQRQRRSLAVVCDVANSASVEKAANVVRQSWGTPQVVVNNAGIVRRASVQEMSEEDWDGVVDVNLKGTFLVTRALLPPMLQRRQGRIINVASISATLGTPRLSAYCAAKWGVVGFTKSLAEELRESGLQAIAVLPGSVDTDMLKGSGFPPQMTPEEVAGVIVYASLDAPAAMNGSAIDVFGP